MRDGNHQSQACPICGMAAHLYCLKVPARYFHCEACGTMFQSPMPSIAEMLDYVNSEYSGGAYDAYVQARALKRLTFIPRARQIRERARGTRLLDVGASCGYFVEAALEQGFDAYGVELSPVAVRAAPTSIRRRLAVRDANQFQGGGAEPFDVVTAFDILEHTLDPLRFLMDLRGILREGGLLVITTPDTGHVLRSVMRRSWPMLQPSQHTVLFSRRSLRLALSMAGYQSLDVSSASKALTTDCLARQVGIHNRRLAELYAMVSCVLPKRVRTFPVAFNIGEMMAFAVRPH